MRKIAFVGNPGSGKTILINSLPGRKVRASINDVRATFGPNKATMDADIIHIEVDKKSFQEINDWTNKLVNGPIEVNRLMLGKTVEEFHGVVIVEAHHDILDVLIQNGWGVWRVAMS